MNREPLKPCPFCGGTVLIWDKKGFGVLNVIECRTCRTRFLIPWNESEDEEALKKHWNRRADG